MKAELERKDRSNNPSSYERILKWFEKASKEEGENSSRHLELKDGTRIEFDNSHVVNKTLFTIGVYTFGRNSYKNLETRFVIDEDGKLKGLLTPKINIKVGDREFIELEGKMMSSLGLRDDILLKMGEDMVSWLENIIRQNKYSNHPITLAPK